MVKSDSSSNRCLLSMSNLNNNNTSTANTILRKVIRIGVILFMGLPSFEVSSNHHNHNDDNINKQTTGTSTMNGYIHCRFCCLAFVPMIQKQVRPERIGVTTQSRKHAKKTKPLYLLPIIQIHQEQDHYNHAYLQSRYESRNFIINRSPAVHSTLSLTRTPTRLQSLQKLIDDVLETKSSKAATTTKSTKTIFVGGKGGVGKTTISSALAVCMASNIENDQKILIVSTDPAHSLGDALDINLHTTKSPRGSIVATTDPLTNGRLFACEIDAQSALDEFRTSLEEAFDVYKLADALGISVEIIQSLGLEEFSSILKNPPPGLDELVALSNVLDRTGTKSKTTGTGSNNNSKDPNDEYDIIIVDTAPTGHTLRLLALPQFLDGLLGKLIQLRLKLSGIASTIQSFLGNNNEQATQRKKVINDAVSRLEEFRIKMSTVRTILQDSEKTRFVVVTVPTKLGISESKRLLIELANQQVSVTDIVVNQCLDGVDGIDDDDQQQKQISRSESESSSSSSSSEAEAATAFASSAMMKYYERRKSGQSKWIKNIQQAVDDVSNSVEYKNNNKNTNNGNEKPTIAVTTVPYFDVELVGVPALGYVGSQVFRTNSNFAHLIDDDNDTNHNNNKNTNQPKLIICGGKGGVGKTTTSASLAVTMAAAGHKVALISTDPAHSLGDAIDMNLKNNAGTLQDCSLVGVPGNTGTGSLSVLEIDPSTELNRFKGVVDQLIGTNGDNSGLTDTLRDLQEVFDTLPAGTDEVVALARIVKIVKEGKYDRIILDTAPTGHTLRMLSTPGFLADLIERLLTIADTINSNSMIKLLVSTTTSKQRMDELATAASTAKSTLLSFQFQMYDLEDMFTDTEQTEFIIVTIPTELAVRESIRLLNDLTFEVPDMPIRVRNVVVNQVLGNEDDDDDDSATIRRHSTFLKNLQSTQHRSIDDLKMSLAEAVDKTTIRQPPTVTLVRYLDTEPRGVYGLKAVAEEFLREEQTEKNVVIIG